MPIFPVKYADLPPNLRRSRKVLIIATIWWLWMVVTGVLAVAHGAYGVAMPTWVLGGCVVILLGLTVWLLAS